jgi:nitroreductase
LSNLGLDLNQCTARTGRLFIDRERAQLCEGNRTMDLNEAITGRRAVRDYTVQAVDERAIRLLIDAAVQAPSAVNQQPWTFTVVRDQGVLDRISHGAKSHMIATMSGSPHATHFQSRLSDPKFHIFYHAPVLILISANAQGSWIVEDCALAAENLMLAAYAAGLGSCWIGFAQSFLNTAEGKNALGLPATWVPVAPIIVGHPKAAPPPVARKEPEIRRIG